MKLLVCQPKNSTKTMTPKKTSTRSAQNKMKEIEKPTTHLVQRLHKVSSEKVIETLWERLWKEIKNWSYQKGKMMEEA